MDSVRIASTDSLGLRPLGTSGDRNHARLRDTLDERLGKDHALLLAEPVPKPDATRVDWYVPGTTRAVPLSRLSEEDRAAVEATLATMRDEVLALADKLEREGASGAALASGLRHALVVPGPENVYAMPGETPDAGLRPVLVAWAHARGQGELDYVGGLKAILTAPKPRPQETRAGAAPVAPVADAVAVGGTGAAVLAPTAPISGGGSLLSGLLWLLLAFLVAAILYLLLRSCGFGVVPLTLFDYCRAPAVAARAAVPDTGALVAVVRNLEAQVAAREQECGVRAALAPRPAPVAAPPPPDVADPPPTTRAEVSREVEDVRERVREAGGRVGALQFTLAWEGGSDLDLSVQCPSGETISFSARQGCAGGSLDVDRNTSGGPPSSRPIEHISWPAEARPATGRYRIYVNNFSNHGETRSSIPYRVVITDGDRPPIEIEGSVGRAETMTRRAAHTYDR